VGSALKQKNRCFQVIYLINAQPEKNGPTYASIRSSRGVSKIVGFGAEPLKVPEALIAQIKLREESGLMVVSAIGLPQAGDNINILEGPFKGLKAVFSHVDGLQRSIVLINLLNQQTPTSLPNTQIKKLA